MILPRRDVTWGFIARAIFESQVLRFVIALLPFGVAAIVWPWAALPISQAPIVMLAAIGIIELRVLRIRAELDRALAGFAKVGRRLGAIR